MNKVLVLFFASLFLTACSDDSSQVSSLKSELREAQFELDSCQNNLRDSRSANNVGGFNQPEETQEPQQQEAQEPQYETVEAFKLSSGTTCYEREVETCGMLFSNCNDGYVYRCMQDVKYKMTEEQRLVE